jgi:hypothetical protein
MAKPAVRRAALVLLLALMPVAVAAPTQATAAPPTVTQVTSTSNCQPFVVIAGQWPTGAVIQVTLRNIGTTTWQRWQAVIQLPPRYRVMQLWGGSMTVIGDIIVVTGAGPVPPGGTVTFGFALSGSGPFTGFPVTCTGF